MATIQKRNGSYKITCSCGYDVSGKQIRKHMTWTPPKGMSEKQIAKELERQKVLFEEQVTNGQILTGNIRFSEFADKWFTDYAEKQLRPKTLSRYKSLMKRITPAIGHIRLDKLQPHHFNAFYNNLAEDNIRADIKYKAVIDFKELLTETKTTKKRLSEMAGVSISTLNSITQGKNISKESAEKVSKYFNEDIEELFEPTGSTKLSNHTIQHYHRLCSVILQTAVTWQVIFANPCDRVKPPKVEPIKPKYLDEGQAAILIKLIEAQPNKQYEVMVKLFLYSGFRRGELCGLEWSDVDFISNVITISRTSLYLPEKGTYTDTAKNETSLRSVKIPLVAIELLKDYRKWQKQYKASIGSKWTENNRLFTTWDGQPINPDVISSWFRDFVQKNNLPDINIHSLRHTNATLQIAGGVSAVTLAKRLGHASPVTTNKIYTHAIRSADEAAAQVLEDIFNPQYDKKKKTI